MSHAKHLEYHSRLQSRSPKCLKYQWYFRNAGSGKWYKSGVRDNTYDDVMTKARANREVYCVITDAFGSQIVTDAVTLTPKK